MAANITLLTKGLNAIRNESTPRYTNAVPEADGTLGNLHSIGQVLTTNKTFANEFLEALYDRIAMTRIVNMDIQNNPLRQFKKVLGYGESYVEYAYGLAKARNSAGMEGVQYAKEHFMDINLPEMASSISHINYEIGYDTTIIEREFKKAFLSWEALDNFINGTIDNLYRSMEYDEFIVMKYIVAKAVSEGEMGTRVIPEVTNANAREIVTRIKSVSNDMTFLNTKYSQAGMPSRSLREDQFILVTADFEARITTEVLATSYNMSKADFNSRMLLVDSFGELDTDRLDVLLSKDPNYTTPDADQLAEWSAIPAVIIDRDWFTVFDTQTEIDTARNQMIPYQNYSLNVGRIMTHSPFFKACAFTVGEQAVISVTVTPSTKEISAGEIATFTADVEVENLANPNVVWTSDNAKLVVDRLDGKTCYVRLTEDLDVGESVTLTATSVFDNSKTGTATITAKA